MANLSLKHLVILFYIGVLLFDSLGVHASFNTLFECKKFAARHEESPKSDDSNWNDPIFASFYSKMLPSFLKRIALKFGFGSNEWDVSRLEIPLKRVVELRQKIVKPHPWTVEIEVKEGTRLFIWGDLYGAIHSFVRGLEELERREIINENLKIIKNDDYIVLLGNAINLSPYSYQMLELILSLMEKNPERFIYSRGLQEKGLKWKDGYVMRQPLIELARKAGKIHTGDVSLENALSTFFNTLPDLILFKHIGQGKEQLICSHTDVPYSMLSNPKVMAWLAGERRGELSWTTTGLSFLGFDGNAAKWSLLSAPISIYQELAEFYSDSFMEISVEDSFTQSILNLFSRDMRTKEAFKKESHYLSVGLSIPVGEAPKKISIFTVGSSLCLTGAMRPLGRAVRRGILAAFRNVNEQGGVSGSYVKLVGLDDQYSPRLARKNIDLFLDQFGINVILCPTGTPTLDSYLDLVRKGDVFVFYPVSGSETFRTPDLLNLINQHVPYANEVQALMNFVVSEYKLKQYAIVYPDDSFGNPLMRTAKEILEKLGVKSVVPIPFSRDQTSFEEQVKKLKEVTPEGIAFFFAAGSLASAFLSQTGTAFLVGKHLAALSYLDDIVFRQFITKAGLRFTFSYGVPDPNLSELGFVKEYRSQMGKYHYPIDSNSLEGFLGASAFIEAMKKVGSPFKANKLMGYLESLQVSPVKNFIDVPFDRRVRGVVYPTWIKSESGNWIAADEKKGLDGAAKK
ncbi:TPA: hypothetical protein DDZ86_01330 [Candidatus Dependentiae bacterium]|nr:MAG: putative ABC-type branched-chain amino acid transport system, periplasmic component [candidate division TM6 bacterium GW2011_GWF2_43_87]HBL98268.1 hypothetical protein [Candidatus Dependentiae bacterium]